MAEAGKKIKHDDFVLNVVKDPSNVPAVVALTGYIGPSTDATRTRIYSDLHLSSYVDVPTDAILDSKELANSPLGGSILWVKASALDPQAEAQARAKFLTGPIPARAAPMTAAPFLCIPPTEAGTCPVSRFCPPTPPVACATQPFPVCHPSVGCPPTPVAPCVTQPFPVCQPTIACSIGCPPTPVAPCLTHALPVCHPSIVGCPPSDFVPCRTIGGVCPTRFDFCNPTEAIFCVVTRSGDCVRQSVNVPCISAEFCPTLGPCQSIACGGASVQCGFGGFGQGGGGGLIR